MPKLDRHRTLSDFGLLKKTKRQRWRHKESRRKRRRKTRVKKAGKKEKNAGYTYTPSPFMLWFGGSGLPLAVLCSDDEGNRRRLGFRDGTRWWEGKWGEYREAGWKDYVDPDGLWAGSWVVISPRWYCFVPYTSECVYLFVYMGSHRKQCLTVLVWMGAPVAQAPAFSKVPPSWLSWSYHLDERKGLKWSFALDHPWIVVRCLGALEMRLWLRLKFFLCGKP